MASQRGFDFDKEVAERVKERAIDRVERAADEDWLSLVSGLVRHLALTRETLTTDDVWAGIGDRVAEPSEPRAMGAVMRTAARSGWVEATDRTVKSSRVKCHRRPIRVWRSLLRGVK